jgi:hypothetical protein
MSSGARVDVIDLNLSHSHKPTVDQEYNEQRAHDALADDTYTANPLACVHPEFPGGRLNEGSDPLEACSSKGLACPRFVNEKRAAH